MRKELESLFQRLHVLIIGPGLGREEYMQKHACVALDVAKQQGMYIVIDADGLWLVGQDISLVKGYRRAVVTPNVMEFKRLSEALVRWADEYDVNFTHSCSGHQPKDRA